MQVFHLAGQCLSFSVLWILHLYPGDDVITCFTGYYGDEAALRTTPRHTHLQVFSVASVLAPLAPAYEVDCLEKCFALNCSSAIALTLGA